jgi:hypothetical protein
MTRQHRSTKLEEALPQWPRIVEMSHEIYMQRLPGFALTGISHDA